MWNWIRVKKSRIFSNPNYKCPKSWEKNKKAFEWYTDLLKKEKTFWLTKWIVKTKVKSEARLKKYWITRTMIEKYLKDKWLVDLLS
jgi:hypothetical protein